MPSTFPLTADPEERFQEVAARYLDALDSGKPEDQVRLLLDHPDLAEPISTFIAEQTQIANLAAPLRNLVQQSTRSGSGSSTSLTPSGFPIEFGDYELLRELGRGGMGVVYEARQRGLNRLVALKMIRAGDRATAEDLQRFRNEAEAAAHLDHPNIVAVHEVGQEEGQLYYSMKWIEGSSLAEQLSRFGAQSRVAAGLVATLAKAVHHAHQRGILHRDLKPSNILIDVAGRPYVADFGLAKLMEADSSLTLTGTVVGSPSFLSPEQASGRSGAITVASDVYGLGGILYALLTGQAPFRGATVLETLELVKTRNPQSPQSINRLVHRDLQAICLKCLEKDPGARYGSALALAEDLDRWLRGEPIMARPVGLPARLGRWCRRNPLVAALAGITLSLAVAGLIGLVVGAIIIARSRAEAIQQREAAITSARTTRKHLYAYDIEHVGQARELADPAELRKLLARYKPAPNRDDLRGFEWYLLNNFLSGKNAALRILRGHRNSVYGLAWSPDGQILASAGEDQTARIWDARSGRLLHTLMGHTDDVNWVAFSPNGKIVATASDDRMIRTWSVTTGKPIHRPWARFSSGVQRLAFSPNGKTVAVGLLNGSLQLLDFPSSKPKWIVAAHGQKVESLAFASRGDKLASAGEDGFVHLWDAGNGTRLQSFGPHLKGASAVTFAHRQPLLASAARDGKILLWDLTSGKQLRNFAGNLPIVRHLAFAPDDRTLASATNMGYLRLWDVPTLQLRNIFPSHVPEAWAVIYSPDGTKLASAGRDGTIRIWDASSRQYPRRIPGLQKWVRQLRFRPDGKYLAAADITGTLQLVEPTSGAVKYRFPEPVHASCLAFDSRGQMLAIGTYDGSVHVWHPPRKTFRLTLRLRGGPVSAVAFTRDGKQLFTASLVDAIGCWDVATGKRLRSFADKGSTLAMSPNHRLLAMSHQSGRIALWDPIANRVRNYLPAQPTRAKHLAFSPDSGRLAVAREDRALELWFVEADRPPIKMLGHSSDITQLVFSPDGRTLAGGTVARVHLWHVATGQHLFLLQGSLPQLGPVAFAPDGMTLVTGNSSNEDIGEVLLWNASRKVARRNERNQD